ncbi:MAG: nucleoside hydrolase [Dehalococcoidia bacterium]
MATTLILDTDIGGDVDDALALAFAIRHPDIDLRAVTTVSGDTVRRAKIAKKLLLLAGRDDVEVAAGVRGEHPERNESADGSHEAAMLGDVPDGLEISGRDAVTLLLEECERGGVQVATVGMQSNVAAALDRDPSFAHDVELLAVMGGVFAPVRFFGEELPPSIDHNLNVDATAAVRALNAGFNALYTPIDVTMTAWLMAPHLERLRSGDALCRELARQIDVYGRGKHWHGVIPDDHVCLVHDPLAVACMVERRFVTTERLPVTVAMHQGHVRTFIDPVAGVEAEVVRSVNAAAVAAWWVEVVVGD